MHPTHRISRSRRGKRRTHKVLRATHTTLCPNCGNPRKPHTACGECGYVRPGLTIKLSKEE
jgi:large subunit ribosomal protein L32